VYGYTERGVNLCPKMRITGVYSAEKYPLSI